MIRTAPEFDLKSCRVNKIRNRADLVVLDGNPLTVPEDQLANLQVEMTWVDGELRYQRED
ncbi:amidohydrolase family protein [Wenzhouxiangella marina]|uniref:amidohydrolase family protein n=1 Tax=Wenzhouxiangella marina TaxID=1579979 RepID=UPI0012E1F170